MLGPAAAIAEGSRDGGRHQQDEGGSPGGPGDDGHVGLRQGPVLSPDFAGGVSCGGSCLEKGGEKERLAGTS